MARQKIYAGRPGALCGRAAAAKMSDTSVQRRLAAGWTVDKIIRVGKSERIVPYGEPRAKANAAKTQRLKRWGRRSGVKVDKVLHHFEWRLTYPDNTISEAMSYEQAETVLKQRLIYTERTRGEDGCFEAKPCWRLAQDVVKLAGE